MNIFQFVIPKSLVATLSVESTVRQALETMKFHRYSALPVIDRDGVYVGTVREGDLFRYFMENNAFDISKAEQYPVKKIMSKNDNPPLFHTASLKDLIEQVKEHNFVPVVDDRGCFIGIILRREVLSYLIRFLPDDEKRTQDKSI
ncbi:MAG: CBS domain-containing protein [Clostridia bacterium]|nr:CBS domain-containing protein [Clostridia bacterium]